MSKKKKRFFPSTINRSSSPISSPDESNHEELSRQLQIASTRFSGPLPPPEILEHYNRISDGLADRIVKMAESQAIHRQYLEKSVIESDIKSSRTGLVFALIIALIGLGGAIFCAHLGQAVIGTVIGGLPLISLVTAFIQGSRSRREERSKKRENEIR